jgi:uncharacterized membrane protein HdeD (DUF308 family)
MQAEEFPAEPEPAGWERALVADSWRATLLTGVVTLVLGIVVAFHPSGSLSVISVLLGILLVVSGLVHLVRVFDRREEHRGLLGGAGLLLIVLGVVLLRHIDLTIAVIGLLIGIAWIVQGLVWLLSGLSTRSVRGHGWWVFFGAVSLVAGIVVTATPVSSVTVLATLVGVWFAIVGAAEIIVSLSLRRASRLAAGHEAGARHDGRAGASGPVPLRPQ